MQIIKSLFIVSLFFINYVQAQTYVGPEDEIQAILKRAVGFSEAVVAYDTMAIGDFYTDDAKIFPTASDIIEGRTAIRHRWAGSNNIVAHKLHPQEIKIYGDEAYDYGYYSGTSTTNEGERSEWTGKYLVIWKKEDGIWRMYLDIWNRGGSPKE